MTLTTPAMPELTENEKKVLAVLCDAHPDFDVLNFDTIAHNAQIKRDETADACRSLRGKNLTEFVNNCWDADGKPCGSGYAATLEGHARLRAAEQVKK